jgi:hypothetical protein
MDLVTNDQMELAGAVEKVQKEAQERQAEMVDPLAPEAQPGLALPGMGAESMPAEPLPGDEAMAPSLEELIGAL